MGKKSKSAGTTKDRTRTHDAPAYRTTMDRVILFGNYSYGRGSKMLRSQITHNKNRKQFMIDDDENICVVQDANGIGKVRHFTGQKIKM